MQKNVGNKTKKETTAIKISAGKRLENWKHKHFFSFFSCRQQQNSKITVEYLITQILFC